MGIGSHVRLVLVVAACAAAMAVPGCSCAQHSTAAASAQAKKLAALKELRDSGVISPEEYAEKVAALGGSHAGSGQAAKLASLKELRDSGVISEEEYTAKVAALGGGSGSGAGQAAGQAQVRSVSAAKGPGVPTVAHPLMDQAWGLPWGTIKLPSGWGFNGGVVHAGTKGCVASGDSPMFTAESPDKQFGISILPLLKTNWTTDQQMGRMMQQGGCPMVPVRGAAEYLTKYILPHVHGQFQVVEVGPEPMFAQNLQQMEQMNRQMDQGSSGPYIQSQHHTDTARVLVSYTEGGRTIHEMASAMVGCSDTRMQMPMMGGSRPSETIECMGLVGMLIHVPDDGTPFTIAAMNAAKPDPAQQAFFAIEPNPAWQQRFNQAAQETSRQLQAEGQANLAASRQSNDNSMSEFEKQQAIRQGVSDYSRQVHNNVYQNRQAANSQVNGAYAAHMGDYNVYTNPATGQQVQLSNQYNNTYVNQYGTAALQTNSANDPGVNWTLMQPKY